MPRFLDQLLDLGPADDPRRVAVGRKSALTHRELVSTPGARIQLNRAHRRDGELQRALIWLLREGHAFEWLDAPALPTLTLDRRPVTLAELRSGLSGR